MKRYIAENELLDEATYYGRNKNLIECEKQLQIIINQVHKSPVFFGGKTCGNAFHRIEKLLEETFGFESVLINDSAMLFEYFQLTGSAGFTIPIVNIFKYGKFNTSLGHPVEAIVIDRNHKATRIKNGKGWHLRMCIGCFDFMNYGENSLTAREILAVILHEIGHNFYNDPGRETIGELLKIAYCFTIPDITAIQVVSMYGRAQVGQILNQIIFDCIDSVPGIRQLVSPIISAMSAGLSTIQSITTPIEVMKRPIVLISLICLGNVGDTIARTLKQLNPFEYAIGAIRYDGEKYADAFATAYGYGADVFSALQKIERNTVSVSATFIPNPEAINGFLQAIYGILKIVYLPISMFDEHPDNIARNKNTISYMEEVDANKLPPSLKKEYLKELEKMKQERLNITDYSGYDMMTSFNKFQVFIQDLMNLSDIRELTSTIKKYNNLDL